MKKNLLLAACLLAAGFSHAQESVPLKPFSSTAQISDYEPVLNEVFVPVPDLEALAAEDTERDHQGLLYRAGQLQQVSFNLTNSGTWSLLPNGDKVWRVQITAPGAKGTALYFDQFYLPAGSRMHVYSPDRKQMIGAFTSYNNHESMLFSTVVLKGESCVVEYYEPAQARGMGIININEVAYVYRGADLFSDEEMASGYETRASDPCEVDVKCPEGSAWSNQIRGVCRIEVKVGSTLGYCSGSAINNTAQDCTPYVLTAQHCGHGASTADFNQWKFRWNYQKATCAGTASAGQSMTGAALIANSNDGGTNLNKGDFILCELNNPFLSSANVYLNGWDRNNTASPNGVSIHHPAGDYKKISTYTSSLVSSGWSAPNTHWRVVWAATVTNHGVTEGGSSGSPIFNSSKLICGQLSGGSSYCTSPTDPDLYGKTSFCWNSSGTTTNRQLQPWLDPLGTGVTTLTGRDNNCVAGEADYAIEDLFAIYPNPAKDVLTIESSGMNESVHKINIYDQTGKLVISVDVMPGIQQKTISLEGLQNGVYNVTISNDERTVSRKFVKL